jgi:hypothetical protein
MDLQLIDRIYESSLVPELWPDVLDELGRIAEATGGTLFITKAGSVRNFVCEAGLTITP